MYFLDGFSYTPRENFSPQPALKMFFHNLSPRASHTRFSPNNSLYEPSLFIQAMLLSAFRFYTPLILPHFSLLYALYVRNCFHTVSGFVLELLRG